MKYQSIRLKGTFGALLLALAALPSPARPQQDTAVADSAALRLAVKTNLLTGYPALNPDGSVNAVIEIPAGSNAKWEVTKTGTAIEWEMEDGKPRVVQYLAYPVNYGMVPGTLSAKETGGDGDPLDVLVLGEAVARGSVVRTRIVGLLKLLDDGERDDKLIAIPPVGPLSDVRDLADLRTRYPGVTAIIEIWFLHYKGADRLEIVGWGDAATGMEVLQTARDAVRAGR